MECDGFTMPSLSFPYLWCKTGSEWTWSGQPCPDIGIGIPMTTAWKKVREQHSRDNNSVTDKMSRFLDRIYIRSSDACMTPPHRGKTHDMRSPNSRSIPRGPLRGTVNTIIMLLYLDFPKLAPDPPGLPSGKGCATEATQCKYILTEPFERLDLIP